jgi:hypothetical protein
MRLEPYESLIEKLPYADALVLVGIISNSDNWVLSPYNEDVFTCNEEARLYIKKNPNAPLMICAKRSQDNVLEKVLVSYDGSHFVIDGSILLGQDDNKFVSTTNSMDNIIQVVHLCFMNMVKCVYFDDFEIEIHIQPFKNKVST